ncbi:hypothetical protein ABPG74_011834 [Tetrahymena malaccensis]
MQNIVQNMKSINYKNKPFFKFVDDQTHARNDEYHFVQKKRKKSLFSKLSQLAISMILQLILTILVVFPYIIFSAFLQILAYFCKFWKQESSFNKHFINPILKIIFMTSSLFLFFRCAYDFKHFDEVQHLWFLNAFYLFATQMLISTYIKSVKHDSKLKQIFSLKNLFSEDNIAINVFDVENKSTKYVFDIKTNNKLWKKEYENILLKLEVDLNAQVFNNFFSTNYNPQIYEQKGYKFVKNQNEELLIGRWLYPVLSLMAFIKMTLTAIYFYQHNKFKDIKDIFYLIILSLFYVNLTWILSKTLGNYDLRRKTVMLRLLNDQLVMSGAEIDYHEKLDVLSVRSLETWDNVRRAVLEFFKFKQSRLEACYVCLFFYYLFVGIACLTAYGDIYIFLSKDSIYLDPIMIISNSMDFVILNIILFTRIYNGQKFNNTFSETDDRLDSIIGVVEDLLQIYDYYFNKTLDNEPIDEKLYFDLAFRSDQKLNVSYLPLQSPKKPSSPNPFNPPSQSYIDQVIELNKVESSNIDALQTLAPKIKSNVSEVDYGSRPSHYTEKTERIQNMSLQSFDNPPDFYTIYDIFVAKIKYNSKYYIDEKIDFMGKPYELNFSKQLQIEMLQSAYKTLKRIKQQVEIDSKTFCYKFLGLIKVQYQETLITVVLAILTVMPQILTKLISIFKQNV